jgi:hypothetical protein
MNTILKSIVTIMALALMSVMWTPALKADNKCPQNLDFIYAPPPDVVADITNPDPKFLERAKAVTFHNACQALKAADPTDVHGFGEGFDVRLLALLEYPELFRTNTLIYYDTNKNKDITVDTVQKANDLLRVLVAFKQAHPEWVLGTTVDPLKPFLGALASFLSNYEAREGEYDVDQNALTFILNKYGPSGKNRIDAEVYQKVLSIMDFDRNVGLRYGLSPAGVGIICAAVCLPFAGTTAGYLICLGACSLDLGSAEVTIPESENHINNILISQYLANQILWDQCDAGSCNTSYDNSRNGLRAELLNRLAEFLRKDFIEYNSHNYQDYTMTALLNLYTSAQDPAVKNAAQNVLDYISAKVAVSSNDARRSTPFRRKAESDYNCPELIDQKCHDPQTSFYMMLAGVTDIAQTQIPTEMCTAPGLPQACCTGPNAGPTCNSVVATCTASGQPQACCTDPGAGPTCKSEGKNVLDNYSFEFGWAAASDYQIPDLILDLFVNRDDRKFYQFFHYCNTGCNDELYFASPSYLIAAGGLPTEYAYKATIPFPLDTVADILGIETGKSDDLGQEVPTVLMPTANGPGEFHSRVDMIRFSETGSDAGVPNRVLFLDDQGLPHFIDVNPNICVARNFACGLNPVIPDAYKNLPSEQFQTDGPWSFIDKSQPGPFGYYVAVYQNDGFGFFEVYDTKTDEQGLQSFADFKQRALANNGTRTFTNNSDNNFYKTISGSEIQFNPDSKIITIDGHPPYDPNRTNGDIINYDPKTMTIKITNPYFQGGKTLTLDASNPPNPICSPGDGLITVAGPVNFADTCVGQPGITTLNVCNTGSGNLCVYNILSKNSEFEVTEPSSGYPVTVSPDFCFPFQAKFEPTTVGAASSTLQISSSDAGKPNLNVAVTGKGTQQSISAAIANAGIFGDACLGTFKDLDLTIVNSGGCPLKVTSITSSSAEFVTPASGFPMTIGAGSSAQVPIRFQPVSTGAKTTTITINSNDPVSPAKVVNVSGNAPTPLASTSGALDFGQLCIDQEKTKTVKVCDTGKCNLTVTGASLQGQCNGLELVNAPSYPLTISPDFCFDFNVKFKPLTQIAPSCTLQVTTDDPAHTTITFPITASVGAPNLVLDPTDLTSAYAFPATVSDPNSNLGCYSDKTVVIRNNGTCPATITGIIAPAPFSVVAPTQFPVTLPVGQETLTVTVRFKPTADASGASTPGSTQGTLVVSSTYGGPMPDKTDGLCGEAVARSGVRVLVVDSLNNPINGLDSLTLTSKGVNTPSPINISLKNVSPTTATVCGNTIKYHLDSENLPPTQTTGSNPKSSYNISAKEKNKQVSQSLTLGQCEFKQFILKLQ